MRGLVLFLCGKLPQATQHVNSALRLDPSHQQAQQLRKRVKDVERLKDEGNALFKALQYDAAIAKYTETLDVWILTLVFILLLRAIISVLVPQRRKGRVAKSGQHCYQTGLPPLSKYISSLYLPPSFDCGAAEPTRGRFGRH